VPVEFPVRDEVGQRSLIDPGGTPIGKQLFPCDGVEEVMGDHKPTDPERWRKGLARRSRVHDAVRVQPLERAHRASIVPILGVVVVPRSRSRVVVEAIPSALPDDRERAEHRWETDAPV
jgi:hypothetical protein